MDKIPVVEIFSTIQGEGPGLGKPSLFIRLGGCNLRCQFQGEACDTPYAVFTPEALTKKNPALKAGYNKWYTYTVKEMVKEIKDQPIRHLVFSGGEPALYQEFIREVVIAVLNIGSEEYADFENYTPPSFEMETNGTIPIVSLKEFHDFTFNISVKLSSSNQEKGYDNKRINPEALASFPDNRSVYKFVITDPKKDLVEIKEILGIRPLPVYLMPEGMDRQTVLKNSPAVIDMCIKNKFRFTPREHINVWDIKKGV
jgi:7-carboxy-7-deazaguanine synthase